VETDSGPKPNPAESQDQAMSHAAVFFVALVSTVGLLTATFTLTHAPWWSGSTFQFIFYLLLAILSSRLKVILPGVFGTLSVNFIFILLSAVELQPADTVVISCTATLAQCLLAAKSRPKPVQLAFNLGNAALCGALCNAVYAAPVLRKLDSSMPVLLFWAAASYFLVNTLMVSEIIALTEKKNPLRVWMENFFWTGPQYIFGAGLVWVIHICNRQLGWQYAVLAFPGIYLLDRSYRVYLRRLQEEKQHASDNQEAYARLAEAQQRMMALSRQAGMAEVATGVLHNVGNVLNSVNVAATIVADKVRKSRVDNLVALIHILEQHNGDLPEFLANDPKGQRVLPYLAKLGGHLRLERDGLLKELGRLSSHVGHIKQIVATQQSYAKVSGLVENINLPDVVEDALGILEAGLARHEIKVEREFDILPTMVADKHQILQILLNLLRNAKQAIKQADGKGEKVIRVSIRRLNKSRVSLAVEDSGVGLPPENLTRIFGHGFTTKADGHGFGLHSCALAASQMGGSLRAESEGVGRGATFILELPLRTGQEIEKSLT
jgi:signal transduction histidine kinase